VSEKMTTSDPTSEIVKEITNQSTTHDIIVVLKMIVQYLESFTMDKMSRDVMSAAADRLESQEQTIAALTARAEQAERERDALISSIERLRTKKIVLCSICEFEDLIACCHKNHCEGYQLFKRRGLPQEGEGK
jgi:hypothetical protein